MAVALIGLAVHGEDLRISLSAENQPLGEVLKTIQKSSGVQVELSDKKWAQDPVSFSVKNSDLEYALKSMLSGYDYVLEWYAAGNDFSKVVVTVHERKAGGAGFVDVTGRSGLMLDSDKVPMVNQDLDALAVVYCKEIIGTNSQVKSMAGLDMETVRTAYADLRNVIKK